MGPTLDQVAGKWVRIVGGRWQGVRAHAQAAPPFTDHARVEWLDQARGPGRQRVHREDLVPLEHLELDPSQLPSL